MKKLLLSSAVLLSTVFVTACSQNQASTDPEDDEVEMTTSSTSNEESSTSTSTSSTQTSTSTQTATSSEPFNPADYTTVDFAVWNHDEIEKGQKITFSGKVLQNQKQDEFYLLRIAIDGDYNKVVMVGIPSTLYTKVIAENDIISVYGKNIGLTEYQTVRGDTRTIPLLRTDHYEVTAYGN